MLIKLILSGNKRIYKFLLEVKTQATLPSTKDVQQLVRAYNQTQTTTAENAIMTQTRAETLIKQIFG